MYALMLMLTKLAAMAAMLMELLDYQRKAKPTFLMGNAVWRSRRVEPSPRSETFF